MVLFMNDSGKLLIIIAINNELLLLLLYVFSPTTEKNNIFSDCEICKQNKKESVKGIYPNPKDLLTLKSEHNEFNSVGDVFTIHLKRNQFHQDLFDRDPENPNVYSKLDHVVTF